MKLDPDSTPLSLGLRRVRLQMSKKEAGNAAFRAGLYNDAFEAYTAAINADPALKSDFVAKLACNRAVAATKLGRHADAVRDCTMAIEIDDVYTKVGPVCLLTVTVESEKGEGGFIRKRRVLVAHLPSGAHVTHPSIFRYGSPHHVMGALTSLLPLPSPPPAGVPLPRGRALAGGRV